MEGIRQGFVKGRRTKAEVKGLEVASWTFVGIHPDGKVAREIARPIVCFYLPTHFKRQLETCGVDISLQSEISADLAAGRYDDAVRKTTDDVVDRLSITGTPAEVAEKIAHVSKEGIDQFVVAPADNLTLANLGLGRFSVKGALDAPSALRLIERQVMPAVVQRD
jgi:alkanesulfonate monooxygenase SsuD/methylene tetrahydromethanopterin reductase-like flavin-dependent oxidoreductase (luciferase family)